MLRKKHITSWFFETWRTKAYYCDIFVVYSFPLTFIKFIQYWYSNIFIFSANCDYWRWGSGGRQESINAICILALNIINDKVVIISMILTRLWRWVLFDLKSVAGFLGAMVVVSYACHHWLRQNHLPRSSVQVWEPQYHHYNCLVVVFVF